MNIYIHVKVFLDQIEAARISIRVMTAKYFIKKHMTTSRVKFYVAFVITGFMNETESIYIIPITN